jgi:hypothetical protein
MAGHFTPTVGIRKPTRSSCRVVESATNVVMKNLVTVLLVVAIGILGLFAYSQAVALRQERRQVQELSTKLDEPAPKSASLELQEKCAKQSQEFLSQFENSDLHEAVNHYNVRLNKCFIETRRVKFMLGNHTISEVLSDAFEGKDYGSYIFVSKPDVADYLVSPVECNVTLPTGEVKNCKSSDEFDALVKQYME